MSEPLAFWKSKTLSEMTKHEWESLCDGCAKCCLYKLEDEDTGRVVYTSVVCKLLDLNTCRCTRYPERSNLVPDCIRFTRQLGIKRYETALLMLHKLRAAMVRPGRDRIGTEWPVEVDETYVGGATHGEGRGRHHKTLVVGMVEVLPRKQALGPDPNLPSGQRPQYRGGHGRSFIAGR